MSWLEDLVYAPPVRANGMRLPPTTTALRSRGAGCVLRRCAPARLRGVAAVVPGVRVTDCPLTDMGCLLRSKRLPIPSVPDTLGIVNIPQTDPPGGSAADSASAARRRVDGRASRWQSHREERRRELIKSARKAVHALGSDASMEDIAAAAGTSKSVFYRYFGDKAGLQQAVGEVVLSQMQRRIQEAAQSAQTPREGLFAMVSAYLQMAETSPNVYTFVTRHAPGEADTAGPPSPPPGRWATSSRPSAT